jgi:hypothetical protein
MVIYMTYSKNYLIAFLIMAASTTCSAQSARSLFDSGKGVSFDAEAPILVESETADISDDSIILSGNDKETSTKNLSRPSPMPNVESIRKNHSSSNSLKTKLLSEPQPDKTDFSGLSYTIFKEISFETFEEADPSTIFLSGDRIRVEVTSNKPGTLITGNIDSAGKATLLSVEGVRSGDTTRIPQNGALKFVGNPGTERLVFVLSREPFSSSVSPSYESYIVNCKTSSNTRSLIVDDSAGNQFQLIDEDGKCSAGGKVGAPSTRSIVVDLDENSGYGVVPDKNLKSGQLLSLIIKLNHR